MGGVRGDVIALGFLQTTIMEMGQPPPVQNADPAMWVKARQYTGRVVTVSNAKVFDEPVFNYTREFPYLWEEMTVPVAYRDDRAAAERDPARRGRASTRCRSRSWARTTLRRAGASGTRRKRSDLRPRVYWRMTDNWLELTVRFVARDHGVRDLKDAMTPRRPRRAGRGRHRDRVGDVRGGRPADPADRAGRGRPGRRVARAGHEHGRDHGVGTVAAGVRQVRRDGRVAGGTSSHCARLSTCAGGTAPASTLVPQAAGCPAASGVSVAYVFVHVLPDLAAGQRPSSEAVRGRCSGSSTPRDAGPAR